MKSLAKDVKTDDCDEICIMAVGDVYLTFNIYEFFHLPMVLQVERISLNQIFRYTRNITPKLAGSLQGPSPRHCSRAP